MRIDITVDSRPPAWGRKCTAALATRAAETLATWIGEALQAEYPDAEVRTSAHDYTEGESTKLVSVNGVGAADVAVWERVHDLAEGVSETRWQDALSSVLPKRRGRKPPTEPPGRLSTTVPSDVDRWLRAQPGSISSTITRLVRAAMGEGE